MTWTYYMIAICKNCNYRPDFIQGGIHLPTVIHRALLDYGDMLCMVVVVS